MTARDDRWAADALARGFADQLQRIAQRLGASDDAARAAHAAALAASRAATDGDVCVALDAIGHDAGAPALRAALLASGVVGLAAAPKAFPLVLDGERLYLHRHFDHERRLAQCVRERAAAPAPNGVAAAALRADDVGGAVDWQRIAAALALRNRFTVISGGPGTGKTTTVTILLAALLEAQPDARIALAAPTGKAAARMVQALRERAHRLPPSVRDRIALRAGTVHRLLAVHPASGEPRHHAANPLPLDLLVVDEGSMLDLALARRLFDAVPATARLVLLGDKDQLAAVEAGSVFADLAADPSLGAACIADLAAATGIAASRIVPPAPLAGAAGLPDRVVWLQHSWRFGADSAIGRLAEAVRSGDGEGALRILRAGGPDLRWFDDPADVIGEPALAAMRAGYAPYVDAVRRGAAPAAVLAAFERFRVLCAVREGPRGVDAVNAAIERTLRDDPREAWYAGRALLVTRNDPALGLANGDVGVVLPDASGVPQAWFAGDDGAARVLPPARLPAHETAFAMTVHKAQGSEFDAVQLVLPARPLAVASRELVYTALTRARRGLQVVAAGAVLAAAVAAPTRRNGGLGLRLASSERPRAAGSG